MVASFYQDLSEARWIVLWLTIALLAPFAIFHLRRSWRALAFLLAAFVLPVVAEYLDRAVERDSNGPSAFSLPGWIRLTSTWLDCSLLSLLLALATAAVLQTYLRRRGATLLYVGLGMVLCATVGGVYFAYHSAIVESERHPMGINFDRFNPARDIHNGGIPVAMQMEAELVEKEPVIPGQVPSFTVTVRNASGAGIPISEDSGFGTGLDRRVTLTCYDSGGGRLFDFHSVLSTAFPADIIKPGETRTFDLPGKLWINGSTYWSWSRDLPSLAPGKSPSMKPGHYLAYIALTYYKDTRAENVFSRPVYFEIPGK